MGRWSQYLDTEVSVELDFSEIDKMISEFAGDEYFSGALDVEAEKIKKAWTKGAKAGIKEIARSNKQFQNEWLNVNCDNPTGMLASSITDRRQTDYRYLVGTTLNHIYPMSLEFGRKGFSAKPPKKALAFYLGGELVFRKSVGRARPRPFVAPAYEDTKRVAETIMLSKIGEEYS